MAALCPQCGYQDTQVLGDQSQCLSCGLHFTTGEVDTPAPKKKAKK